MVFDLKLPVFLKQAHLSCSIKIKKKNIPFEVLQKRERVFIKNMFQTCSIVSLRSARSSLAVGIDQHIKIEIAW